MDKLSLYPIHVDSPEVKTTVHAAVTAACSALDDLFDANHPEVRGISSEFAGVLEAHIHAMLTGVACARLAYAVPLPTLLASDDVFGKPFSLPAEQGCGYMVIDDTDGRMLSAYSHRFIAVRPHNDVDLLFCTYDGAVHATLEAMRQEGFAPAERRIRIIAGVWDDNQGLHIAYVEPVSA